MKPILVLLTLLSSLCSVAYAQPTQEEVLALFAVEAPPKMRAIFKKFFANGSIPSQGSQCTFEWATAEIEEIGRGMKLGNSYIVITNGQTFAATSAACGLAVQDQAAVGLLGNIGYWARFAGFGLHAANLMKLPGESSLGELDRAITYLRYAQSVGVGNNQKMIDQLVKLKAQYKQ